MQCGEKALLVIKGLYDRNLAINGDESLLVEDGR